MTECLVPQYSLQMLQLKKKRRLVWQRVGKFCLVILSVCILSGIFVLGAHAGDPVKFNTNQYKGADALNNSGYSAEGCQINTMVHDVVDMHNRLDNQLPQNNPIFYIFRLLGWVLAMGLALLVDGISYAVFQLFSLLGGSVVNGQLKGGLFGDNGFFAPYKGGGNQLISSSSLTGGELIHNLTVIGMALMVISIILLGIQVVIKPQQIKSAVLHIGAGLILVVALPSFIVGGLAITNVLINTTGLNTDGSLGSQIVADNVTDAFYFERANMATKSDATSGGITLALRNEKIKNDYSKYVQKGKGRASNAAELRKILFINPTEFIDSKTMCEDSNKQQQVKHTVFWETKLASRRDGDNTVQFLQNRWDGTILSDKKIGPFSEEYMRYKVSWFNLYVGLAVTGFVLIMSGIKWVRLLFELGIKQGLTQLLALVDVRTMQRVKQCLQSLLGTFAALFGTALSLSFYLAANSWSSSLTVPNGMNAFAWGILQLFIQVGLAWAAIDGPDIFEKIFGVDVGVKNSMQTLFAMQSVGRAAKGVTNGVFGTRQFIPGAAGAAGGESGAVGAAGGGDFARVGGLFGRQGFVSRMGRTAKGAASAIGNTASSAMAIPSALGGFIHGKSAARKALHSTNGTQSGAAGTGTINAGKVNTGSLSVNGSSAGTSGNGSKINRPGSSSVRGGQNSSLRSAAVSPGIIGGHRIPQTNIQSKPNAGSSAAGVHSPGSPALSGSTPASRMAPASVPLASQSPTGGKRANVAKPAPTSAAQPAVSRNPGVRPAAAAQTVKTAINRTPHSPSTGTTRQVTPRMSGSGSAGAGYAANSNSSNSIPLRGSGETLGEHIGGQFQQAGSYIHQRAASLVKDDQGNIKKNALTRPYRAASSASDFAYNATIKRAQKH